MHIFTLIITYICIYIYTLIYTWIIETFKRQVPNVKLNVANSCPCNLSQTGLIFLAKYNSVTEISVHKWLDHSICPSLLIYVYICEKVTPKLLCSLCCLHAAKYSTYVYIHINKYIQKIHYIYIYIHVNKYTPKLLCSLCCLHAAKYITYIYIHINKYIQIFTVT